MSAKNEFRILVIDDNVAIHHDFIKILTPASSSQTLDTLSTELFGDEQEKPALPQFRIDVASQGQEGVMRIKKALEEGRPYALTFVDIRMPPGWDGIETIKHIWAIDKDIQVVICTAYSDYSWEETVEHLGRTDNLLILKKPFDNVSVRQIACALTTKWQLTEESHRYTEVLKKQVADRTVSLQQSLSLIKSTFESSNDGILVVDKNGTIVDYNTKFLAMLQIPQSVIETKKEEKLLEFLQNQLINFDEVFPQPNAERNLEEITIHVLKFKDGKIIECYSQPHKLDDKIIGCVMDFRDITKRAKLEQELKYQATHDVLTGLDNRVKLFEQIRFAVKSSQQNNVCFAVFFIDFDRFKLINDSLSHQVGDEVLKQTARRLESVIRTSDTLARIGGDEFVIIFTGIGKEEDISVKANQIINLFQSPFEIENRKITLTASIGISIFPKDGTSVDMLLRNADVAMYSAKARKGNNFKFYTTEMSNESLEALDRESELRQAILKNELFLCYQPQLDLTNEKIIGVEALIRWQHPTKGILLPIDFIPLAEETGLILPIGEWVMRTACMQNKAWQEAGFAPIRMAINVTIQQFKQQDIVNMVARILKETQLDPAYLEIELTENVILSSTEVINIVTELKKLGVFISIDDFGTGYSSLSYLHRIPLDRLKIDGSFIQHIQSDQDDEVIVRAIIAMAKNLNMEVLAEGVETLDQVNFLKKYQCHDVQGFYFSKPLTKGEIENYLKHPAHKLMELVGTNKE
jgi:diguanylate cyclase (GGDEF)-like protein/PAS domain S-box-containing protein